MRNVVEFADQGGAANVSPILATTTLSGSADMTDLHLNRQAAQQKHRGAWAEMVACCWLLQQGYEVFRNVSPHGGTDIVAMKGAEVFKFDVKSRAVFVGEYLRRTDEQIALGINLLVVCDDGTVRILEDAQGPLHPPRQCMNCGKAIGKKRRQATYCSNRCQSGINPLEPRTCAHCGVEFIGRHQAIYCGHWCGNAAAKARRTRKKAVEASEISDEGFPADDGLSASASFLAPSRGIPGCIP
jgi:hypothetical protein